MPEGLCCCVKKQFNNQLSCVFLQWKHQYKFRSQYLGVKLRWLLLNLLTISHILTTTKNHHNKIILCTARLIFMYMAGTALDSPWALDLSSFLLNGYKVFSPGERHQNMKLFAQHPQLHPQKQKYTTTQVKSSWHVDKASLHINIILLFENLSLATGLQTSHKLVCTSQQKATHIYFCIYQEEHWTCSGLWTCPASYSMAIKYFLHQKDIRTWHCTLSIPSSTPQNRCIPQSKSRFVACGQSFPPFWHHTFVLRTWAWK